MSVPTVASSAWAWLTRRASRFDIVLAIATVGVSFLLILGSPEDFDTGWPEVVAGVGAFVVVLLRRRWPFQLLALSVVWSAVSSSATRA